MAPELDWVGLVMRKRSWPALVSSTTRLMGSFCPVVRPNLAALERLMPKTTGLRVMLAATIARFDRMDPCPWT